MLVVEGWVKRELKQWDREIRLPQGLDVQQGYAYIRPLVLEFTAYLRGLSEIAQGELRVYVSQRLTFWEIIHRSVFPREHDFQTSQKSQRPPLDYLVEELKRDYEILDK